MKKITFLILLASFFASVSCSDSDVNKPRGGDEIPEQVVVRNVVNQNGRSIIYYDLPDDDNLKYVKASYCPRNTGVVSEKNASFFTDSLIVDGFKEAGEYEVKLYSISNGEVASEPVILKVSPLQPSYQYAVENSEMIPDFGGFYFKTINPTNEKLFITVKSKVEGGEWETAYEVFSEENSIEFIKRGMDAVATTFSVTVEDYWGNSFNGEEISLTPLLEEKCDKKLWKQVLPSGEFVIDPYSSAKLEKIWDEVIFATEPNCFQSNNKYNFGTDYKELSFTIDLGKLYHLSRMEEWSIYRTNTNYEKRYEKYFAGGDIKDFEVYGAEFLDAENPLFDAEGNQNPNWTLLFKGVNARPSGSTNNSVVDKITELEEYNYANGIPRDFSFPLVAPNVRYVKFRILSTWGTSKFIVIQEISLYGQPINE